MISPAEVRLVEGFFVFGSLITGIGCTTAVIVTWIKRKTVKQATSPMLDARLDDIADRLSRLDASIDTIAVEVERISEAQRFTARVLADRSTGGLLPESIKSPGTRTPH